LQKYAENYAFTSVQKHCKGQCRAMSMNMSWK
jgi:hypothetical protein